MFDGVVINRSDGPFNVLNKLYDRKEGCGPVLAFMEIHLLRAFGGFCKPPGS